MIKKIREIIFCVFILGIIGLASSGNVVCATESRDEKPFENPPDNWVVILDVTKDDLNSSGRIAGSVEACKMFIDLLPSCDSKVAVLTVGCYDSKNAFVFSEQYENVKEPHLVREIFSLTQVDAVGRNEELFQKLDVAVKDISNKINGDNKQKKKSYSPLGTALLAAVDCLNGSNVDKGNAGIIFITDGKISSGNDKVTEVEIVDEAIAFAKNKNWPIYCIRLNEDNTNGESDFIRGLKKNGGAVAEVTSLEMIDDELFNLLDDLYEFSSELTSSDAFGIAEFEVEVPQYTSEMTILVQGDGLDKIKISSCASSRVYGEYSLTEAKTQKDISVVPRLNDSDGKMEVDYSCIVLNGAVFSDDLKLEVTAKQSVSIHTVYSFRHDFEGNLSVKRKADGKEITDNDKIVDKDEKLVFEFTLKNHDEPIRNELSNLYWEPDGVILRIEGKNTNREVLEYGLQGGKDGCYIELPMSDICEKLSAGEDIAYCAFTAECIAIINGKEFRSNKVAFANEKMEIEIQEGTIDRTAYVFEDILDIDLNCYTKFYDASCDDVILSDNAEEFGIRFDETEGIISIGSFDTEWDENHPFVFDIGFRCDVASGEEKKISVKIKTVNRKIDTIDEEITISRLRGERYNLLDNYRDPDKTDNVTIESASSRNDQIAKVERTDDGEIYVKAGKSGRTTLRVELSDGVTKHGELQVITSEIEVIVVPPIVELWTKHPILCIVFALLPVAIVAMVAQYFFHKKKRRGFKGLWKISVYGTDVDGVKNTFRFISDMNQNEDLSLHELIPDNVRGHAVDTLEKIKFRKTDRRNGIDLECAPAGASGASIVTIRIDKEKMYNRYIRKKHIDKEMVVLITSGSEENSVPKDFFVEMKLCNPGDGE